MLRILAARRGFWLSSAKAAFNRVSFMAVRRHAAGQFVQAAGTLHVDQDFLVGHERIGAFVKQPDRTG